jgi:hypothetical protein
MSRAFAAWLGLAAAPTFAVMAVVTGLQEARAGVLLCGVAPSPLGGMAVMYLLMSGFHLGPWLRRLSTRRPS